jgi:hypothetical protein
MDGSARPGRGLVVGPERHRVTRRRVRPSRARWLHLRSARQPAAGDIAALARLAAAHLQRVPRRHCLLPDACHFPFINQLTRSGPLIGRENFGAVNVLSPP